MTDIADVVIYKNHEGGKFDILISDDGVAWKPAIKLDGLSPTRTVVSLNGSGRFVRLQNGALYMGVYEVEVFEPQLKAPCGRPAAGLIVPNQGHQHPPR